MIVAGIGCRPGCGADEIVALVARAMAAAGRAGAPDRLAVPSFRAAEPGVLGAARRLGRPLDRLDDTALRGVADRCPTRSARALAAVGHASVAEACALAAAGPGGRLLLPRLAASAATCALAEGTGP